MRNRIVFLAVRFAMALQPALALCQQLTVRAESGKQTVLAPADIEAFLPSVKVTTSASGTATTFEGASLKAVLERGGVEFGQTMKGKRLASCLLVEAADGYRVVIALSRNALHYARLGRYHSLLSSMNSPGQRRSCATSNFAVREMGGGIRSDGPFAVCS